MPVISPFQINLGGIVGPVSIGDGSLSADVLAPSTSDDGGAAKCFQSLMDSNPGGMVIDVMPGNYYFEDHVRVDRPVVLRMAQGANLWIRHSGAVGLFLFGAGASGSTVHGGNIVIDRWVNSQEIMLFSECTDPLVERVGALMITTGGLVAGTPAVTPDTHSTTPMRLFSFDSCAIKRVRGCTIIPSYGLVPIYAQYGQHLTVEGNSIGSFDNREIVDTANHVQKHMKKGVWLHHDGWVTVRGNTFKSMGGSTTFFPTTNGPAVEDVIFYQNETGLGPALNEAGHLTVHDNTIEDVLCSFQIRARGLRWGTFTSNKLDNTNDEIQAATEGALCFEAENGGASGQVSHDIAVIGNHSHNPVSGTVRDGAFLLARAVERLSLISNAVKVFRGEYCVRIHPDDCPDFLANGNTFDSGSLSAAPQTVAAYYIEDGTAPRYSIANEVCSGMSTGVVDKGTVTGGVQNETNLVSI